MNIFDKARKYNFDAIKNYISNNGEINICDNNGHSLLTCFINGYFNHADLFTKEEQQILDEHKDDEEFYDSFVPRIFKIQLKEKR